jgi:primosomal protein N' (replication factor Y) (superfamily II helicase)
MSRPTPTSCGGRRASTTRLDTLARVCRVLPDVTAVDRAFDYSVPDALDGLVGVGAIVRVPLHGRRVRGWVVQDAVGPGSPTGTTLLDVLAVVSAGPPADVVELTEWVAWRWSGPRVAVLRSASPPNRVSPPAARAEPVPDRPRPDHLQPDGLQSLMMRVIRQPPLLDRRAQVAALCSDHGSTIVCVADAGRSRALAAYLAREGRAVALLHSFESDAARTVGWRRAAEGGCIVVGGRIAALAPVPDLRAAVVVDDADEALQEERSPTWHARDVLRERARRSGAPFAVCSPAPTVEAIFDAGGFDIPASIDGAGGLDGAGGGARVVEAPPPDVEVGGWPRVQVADRRDEPPGSGLLSETLATALHHAGGPAVCVLNRRGRFRLLVCASCRHLLRWDRSDERPLVCPECGATKLRVLRAGVARVREELEALVPGARVVEVDAAVAEVPEADIIVGTEAVLHRAAVRRRRPALVAYLDLDQELLAPRYRAAAQAQWLLTRGAQLLSGRPRRETLLLVQTRIPDHVVVQALVRGEPAAVAEAEVEYRRTLAYPPFGALAELAGTDDALAAAIDALRALDVQVFGPTDGRALVHAPDWDALANALARGLPAGRAIGRVRAVVDPPRV